MSKWACYRCTYLNDDGLRSCSMCDAPVLSHPPKPSAPPANPTIPKPPHPPPRPAAAPITTWACPTCTYLNPRAVSQCEMCGGHGQGKARSSHEVNRPVNGSVASGSSTRPLDVSPTATAPRTKKRLSSAASIGAWTCPGCSIDNVGSALRCEVCMSSKRRTNLKTINSQPIAQTRADDKSTSDNLYQEITAFCSANKEKFVDDSFPPTDLSIGDLRHGPDDREYARNNITEFKFQWLRPEHIYTPEGKAYRWAIFRDPRPTDILQGAVGNCWLVSSLAVLAERPDLLSHIMLTQQYNHLGIYQVRLCVYGTWKTVIIDDLFPSRLDSHTLAFSRAKKNQLWVSLIEKACAKVYGSYAALIAGRSLEGLAVLTGAPCESMSLEQGHDTAGDDPTENREESFSMDVIWAKLLSSREAGFLMSCSCASGSREISEAECDRVGLLSKHAYSLLDVRHVEGINLVRLRNPWGHHTWKGPYSNKSDLWTPQLRQILQHPVNATADGSFWMPFEDFCSYFDSVDISKVRTDWHELRVPVSCGTVTRTSHSLVVTETTEIDLTVYQDEYRAMHKQEGRGEMDLVVMLFKHAASQHGQLAVHSSRPCALNMAPASSTLITDALIQMVIARAKRHVSAQMGVTTYYLSAGFSGLLVVVENQCEDSGVLCMCNCTESNNVVSTRDVLRTADIIPPLHRQIVMLLTQLEVTANYFVSHQVSHIRQPSRLNTLGKHAVTAMGTRASHEPAITHPLHSPRPMFFS